MYLYNMLLNIVKLLEKGKRRGIVLQMTRWKAREQNNNEAKNNAL